MSATPLTLVSSMATRDVLGELIAQYQNTTAQPVSATAAGGVDVAKRVRGGEAVDVVVLASDVIDKLIAEGKLLAGSRVDIVQSGVGIAGRAGAPHPDISTEGALQRAVSAARTVSYSTGPSGVYLEKMFARWGILETLRSRIVVPPPGVPVASLVASGAAELGFQQLSELLNRPGIDVIGPLPQAIQMLTIFSGGISVTCARADVARALLRSLAAPAAAAVKQRYGMDSAAG
jgi:molybdate transport system substrate-binding protein